MKKRLTQRVELIVFSCPNTFYLINEIYKLFLVISCLKDNEMKGVGISPQTFHFFTQILESEKEINMLECVM